MKSIYSIATCLLLILMSSCQEDEPKPIKNTGYLNIDIGLQLHVKEGNGMLKAAPVPEEFVVNIYFSDGTPVMSFDSVAAMPDTIELETGDYYVEAYSDNNLPAAFLNPYYYGVSGIFTINSNTQHSIHVLCELANVIVTVHYSENITSNFTDYTTTVSSTEGFLVYSRDEIRQGYFQPLALDIFVELTYTNPVGEEAFKSLTGSIPNPLPNRHYEIQVDASIDQGMASFIILLDSTEVLVELVDINDDSAAPLPGAIGYGDLLITEIMYDPDALSDTEGEWFEIYNNTDHSIDLQNLILDRDGTNLHTISASLELASGQYLVVGRNLSATDAPLSYSYGSSITLSNTGANLSIYNEDKGSGPGALIFSVDYGAVGFPDGSGASISLSPDHFNASDAVSGSSWCLSTSTYHTGDAGTPGRMNESCQ